MIGKAPSEVNQYSENMFSLISGLENHLNYLEEKNKNDLILDFLKEKGIEINPEELSKFKINKENNKTELQNNKKLAN
mgnify:CR=1 FL=1